MPRVQRVTVQWTGASFPSACPQGFLFVGADPLHDVVMRESATFAPEHSTSSDLPGGLTLLVGNGRLAVQPHQDLWAAARPRRTRPKARLDPGQWCRWIVNRRFGGSTAWGFEQVTWNIAHRDDLVGTLFEGTPDVLVDERVSFRDGP